MRFTIEGMPPLLAAGIRYLCAGMLMLAWLRWRGHPLPTRRQWRNAGVVGVLLLLGGNGMVGLAMERGVSSGVCAVVVGVTPLFALGFGYLWGQAAHGREWLGMLLGLAGLLMLNFGKELSASPTAAGFLVGAAVSWAFGSIWGRHHDLPKGFMASTAQMLAGGVALLAVALLRGESLAEVPTAKALWSLAYLVFVGPSSVFPPMSTCWTMCVRHWRPAMPTSIRAWPCCSASGWAGKASTRSSWRRWRSSWAGLSWSTCRLAG